MLIELSALERAYQPEEARRLMESNLMQPDVLLYAIQQAIAKGRSRVKALVAITGLRFELPPEVKARLEEMMLQLVEQDDEPEEVNRYALLRGSWTPKTSPTWKGCRSAGLWLGPTGGRNLAHFSGAPLCAQPPQYHRRIRRRGLHEPADGLRRAGPVARPAPGICPVPHRQPPRTPARTVSRRLLTDFLRNHLGRKTSQRIREAHILLEPVHPCGSSRMSSKME